ncbi:hypothetical protein [Streptomyces cucumeris]|uniref:hypothetical protein n=1 Tax=Streptomyces cucumeris TaxID=2962890 RepID=UPI0020C8A45B|nr:hypothetical protein [Streptomyces sp. NEAU-Y11]MCP9211451.1 hypothetical protein [Streptomyces sp. NEAU-Y11]
MLLVFGHRIRALSRPVAPRGRFHVAGVPEEGDVVEIDRVKFVIHDIEQQRPAWVLRPLYGGGATDSQHRRVGRASAVKLQVVARRGSWRQP